MFDHINSVVLNKIDQFQSGDWPKPNFNIDVLHIFHSAKLLVRAHNVMNTCSIICKSHLRSFWTFLTPDLAGSELQNRCFSIRWRDSEESIADSESTHLEVSGTMWENPDSWPTASLQSRDGCEALSNNTLGYRHHHFLDHLHYDKQHHRNQEPVHWIFANNMHVYA